MGSDIAVGSDSIAIDDWNSLWITSVGDGIRRIPYPERLRGKTRPVDSVVSLDARIRRYLKARDQFFAYRSQTERDIAVLSSRVERKEGVGIEEQIAAASRTTEDLEQRQRYHSAQQGCTPARHRPRSQTPELPRIVGPGRTGEASGTTSPRPNSS